MRLPGAGLTNAALLKFSGGDPIAADELKTGIVGRLHNFVLLSYIPLIASVGYLFANRPEPVSIVDQADRQTAVEAFAGRFVDAYLQGPFNAATMSEFCISEIPTPTPKGEERGEEILAPGGRSIRVSSARPGAFTDGYETWSVIVDASVPKRANSSDAVEIPLQVNLSIDRDNRFCAMMLPNKRFDRPAGTPAELVAQIQIADDRPLYNVVKGFLSAMLTGQGDIVPYVSSGSQMNAVNDAPYATMRIDKILANSDAAAAQDVPPKAERVEVNAKVIVQTASGIPLPMEFPLVMSVASGHWQVDAINDSPSIEAPEFSQTDTPTSTVKPTQQQLSTGGS